MSAINCSDLQCRALTVNFRSMALPLWGVPVGQLHHRCVQLDATGQSMTFDDVCIRNAWAAEVKICVSDCSVILASVGQAS